MPTTEQIEAQAANAALAYSTGGATTALDAVSGGAVSGLVGNAIGGGGTSRLPPFDPLSAPAHETYSGGILVRTGGGTLRDPTISQSSTPAIQEYQYGLGYVPNQPEEFQEPVGSVSHPAAVRLSPQGIVEAVSPLPVPEAGSSTMNIVLYVVGALLLLILVMKGVG